jgi:hypothetical protein
MLGSLVAVNNPFPFSISGFNGLTTAQIISFLLVFVIFNAYVVLIVVAMVALYQTSKPRHGVVRTAAIWHFYAVIWMLMAFIGTVWGAPAEKTFLGGTGLATLGIGQRAINEFISMGFAVIAVVCMAIGFARASKQNRAIREEILGAIEPGPPAGAARRTSQRAELPSAERTTG